MRVRVDEARRHHQAAGVERVARRAELVANGRDAVAHNRHVRAPRGNTGAVDDAAAADE
jgi:hypothetical protein